MPRGGRWTKYLPPIGVGVARSSDGLWAEHEGGPILPWLWFKRAKGSRLPTVSIKMGEYMFTLSWTGW